MKIVQVITPSKIAGAERSTIALCRGLAARKHEVWLICKTSHPLIDVAAREGIDVVPMPIGGKANLLAPFRLAQFARGHQVDLIATQLSTASLWGSLAGRMSGRPVVATVRALNSKTCYTLASKIIAVSVAVKNHLVQQGVSPERIEVVYNGIDLNRFVPVADATAAKRQVGLAPEHLVVGVVAHLTKKKGHEWFLKAAAQVFPQAPQAFFLVVGDGPEREALEHQAQRLGLGARVQFSGFQQDVVPWIAAMDVVVLPAIAMEGFGRVLVEAGAMEKPVISSSVGGVPEVVLQGQTGFIVPPNDIPALAEAMLQLLHDPQLRCRMGHAGRRHAGEHFTEERMVANTEKVYARLLGRP